MTDPPEVGGQPGDYEERWAQWFLEQSFFRDFIYRNPRGKRKGTELADALVLFDDVALLVQVKAQCGNHDPVAWATEKLLDALRQLKATHEQLGNDGITKLDHELHGTARFVAAAYQNHIGIIVLAQENPQLFDAAGVVPELLTGGVSGPCFLAPGLQTGRRTIRHGGRLHHIPRTARRCDATRAVHRAQ
jgi:hypothetical protein